MFSDSAIVVEVLKNGKHAPDVHEKHILACVKNSKVQNSLSGVALRHILQKRAWRSHQRMNCEFGSISGVRKYASGEGFEQILFFDHFCEVRICYVFPGLRAMRIFCHPKSTVFIVSDCKNRIATAGFCCHCL